MNITTGIPTIENRASIVLIDIYKFLAEDIARVLREKSFEADAYGNPAEFLRNIHKYTKDTKICTGQDFGEYQIKGIELAEKLNKLGYKKLYLFTGYPLDTLDIPDYVTAIFKDNGYEDVIDALSVP